MLGCTIPAMMMNGTEIDNNIHASEKGNCTSNITLASWNEGDVLLQPAAPFMKNHLLAHPLACSLHKPLRPGRPKGSGAGRPGTTLS
jgi:hypothetical protein